MLFRAALERAHGAVEGWAGATIDFFLAAVHSVGAARAWLVKALSDPSDLQPKVIKTDKGREFKEPVDEFILISDVAPPQPPKLPFPNLVNGLVALNRSPRRIETAKTLLGTNPFLDGAVMLLQEAVFSCVQC